MQTRIYISNKIKKFYKKIELQTLPLQADMDCHSNSWNAHYMPVFGRKCWVLSHTPTRYTVIVPDVKAKDIERFLILFLDNLINQLLKSQTIHPEKIEQKIEEVLFYPTNGNRSCIAYVNQKIKDLEYWKYEFSCFEDIPFYGLGAHINELGSILKDGKRVFIDPEKEFLKWVDSSADSIKS